MDKPNNTSSQNVDQIRDILFGKQLRDYEARVDRLEEEIQNKSINLRDEVVSQVGELLGNLREEINESRNEILVKVDDRIKKYEEVNGDANVKLNEFSLNIKDINTKLKEMEDEFHSQLLEQTKFIYGELQEQISKLVENFNSVLKTVNNEKMGYGQLKAIFYKMIDFMQKSQIDAENNDFKNYLKGAEEADNHLNNPPKQSSLPPKKMFSTKVSPAEEIINKNVPNNSPSFGGIRKFQE